MENVITKSLQSLGLSQKEIKFFLSCFQIGPATINEVSKKARLERSTGYLLASQLAAKGFIKEDLKTYKKLIFTIEPKDLLRLVSAKQRLLRRQEIELEEHLPELQSVYQTSEIRPKVKVFEGNSGLLNIWQDILATKEELLLWTNQEKETLFFTKELHQKFIQERVRKQIPIRVLSVNNEKGKLLAKTDKDSLRQTKLLPKHVDFSAETYIYEDKIAILDYKKDIIGLIIQSQPIASSWRAIFEMNWNNFL